MRTGIEKRFFERSDSGKHTVYSVMDMDKHNFKTVGERFAALGGPPPNLFMQWCNNYISTGEIVQDSGSNNWKGPWTHGAKKRGWGSRPTTLMECTDRILSCGYKEEDIVRYVVPHSEVTSHPPANLLWNETMASSAWSSKKWHLQTAVCSRIFLQGVCWFFGEVTITRLQWKQYNEASESRVVNFPLDLVQDMEDEDSKNNTEDMPE